MPALFVFLLKVNMALIIFCLGYYLVLRRITFYTLNRIYLVTAIIFSTIYPLINLDSFVQKHNIPVQQIIVDWKTPAKNFVNPLVQQSTYWHWATLLFWTGVVMFTMRLLMQLLSLYKLYKNSKPGNIQDHEVRLVKANISPFSFWQSIYVNPDTLNPDDLKNVLKHEQVHVQDWHTLDILLTEISAVFYWFNPGIWLIKRAVRENIEFITDRKILQKGTDSKAYQYSLLNVSLSATTAASIANNFNFSTLKKRITMMNAKRSSNVNLTRYAFLVPAVIICLFAVSLSKAELVKKSKVAYKTIAASVNNSVNKLAKITAPASVTHVAKPAIPLLSDTAKKIQNTVMTISSLAIVDGDTIKKVGLRIDNNVPDSLSYFINERKVTKADFLNLSRNNIATISIEAKKGSAEKSIYVVTKDNHDLLLNSTIHGYFVAKPVQALNTNTTLRIKSDSTLLAPPPLTAAFVAKSDRSTNSETITNGSALRNDNTSEQTQNQTSTENTKKDPLSEVLIIVDGKETAEKDLLAIFKSGSFERCLLEGPNNKEMINKYGDKAKKGVFIVTTKKKN
ncbi:M56 family metallopeptidase [Mucilaginibacter sp. SP1R1]|uniref:M56 family metallopeptidase n=1 Tax=Mucilaginibacter sp. SP1R1 TaxID=2723091 RepID=UPI00160F2089|nr:M56 family metallopeptidase [Mucilaginibacter sp. SP1R1]MBB6148499.1 beta-lactamase regulating signal transducer with metallopeptidase domain [Mucilaginibacter sp. SP1R1]